jgi:DNA-binding ferritin-like protein
MAPDLRDGPLPKLVPGEVDGNPLGLSEELCAEMVDALHRDVATLFTILHQTTKHRWLAQGPEAEAVRAALREHALAAWEDADRLAERVRALGGVPAASQGVLEALSSVPPEDEGLFTMRTMLAHDLRAQEQVVRDLRRHAAMALHSGDLGTAHVLGDVLARQEGLALRLHRLLSEDALAVGVLRQRFGLRDADAAAPLAEARAEPRPEPREGPRARAPPPADEPASRAR